MLLSALDVLASDLPRLGSSPKDTQLVLWREVFLRAPKSQEFEVYSGRTFLLVIRLVSFFFILFFCKREKFSSFFVVSEIVYTVRCSGVRCLCSKVCQLGYHGYFFKCGISPSTYCRVLSGTELQIKIHSSSVLEFTIEKASICCTTSDVLIWKPMFFNS